MNLVRTDRIRASRRAPRAPAILRAGLGLGLVDFFSLLLFLFLLAGPAPARAQDAGALPPGVRVGTAEIAVVGGNAAGARERALEEALRQVVGQAAAEQLDPETRVAQARAIKTLQARARSYVKRYRTVDEKETNGLYSLRIEAEVDDAALRRVTEKWTPAASGAPASSARGTAPSLLVFVSGPGDAGTALVGALATAGAKARLGDPTLTDPARALQAAAKASFSAVAFLSASIADDGIVRGPGQSAVSCQLAVKVVSAPAGQSLAEQTAALRAFADREPEARADCFARAAAAIAPRLLPSGASGTAAAELRSVILDADVVEPPVVAALLKMVRGLGAVSAAEVRRIVPGRATLQVRTRLLAPALAAALSRESSGTITLTALETAGDRVRLRARLRPPAAAPSPTATSPTAVSPSP